MHNFKLFSIFKYSCIYYNEETPEKKIFILRLQKSIYCLWTLRFMKHKNHAKFIKNKTCFSATKNCAVLKNTLTHVFVFTIFIFITE